MMNHIIDCGSFWAVLRLPCSGSASAIREFCCPVAIRRFPALLKACSIFRAMLPCFNLANLSWFCCQCPAPSFTALFSQWVVSKSLLIYARGHCCNPAGSAQWALAAGAAAGT